jgi:hypothetical protein
MDRNGAMEQSQSVVPVTQIAAPSHLGLIMPSLHHGMPTTSVAHEYCMLGTRCSQVGTRCGCDSSYPCGLP